MTATNKDLYEQAARLRKTLSAAQAQTTELVNLLYTLPLPSPEKNGLRCSVCGLSSLSQRRLEEHLANVHDVVPADDVA